MSFEEQLKANSQNLKSMTNVMKRGPIGGGAVGASGSAGNSETGSTTSTVRQDRNQVLSQIAAQLQIAIAGKTKGEDSSSEEESSSESLYSDSDDD